MHMLWFLFSAVWVSTVHICNDLSFEEDIGREMAKKHLEFSRVNS